MTVPDGYYPVDEGDPSLLLDHCLGFVPLLLKTDQDIPEPYAVWCPRCGVMESGATVETALSNWNDNMADPTGAKRG